MFRKRKNDPPPQPTQWPRHDPGSAARLEASLNAFFAARTIADCQGPIGVTHERGRRQHRPHGEDGAFAVELVSRVARFAFTV